MNVSINWLKYYVDINVPVEELCDKMVMAGFEVESIEDLSATMSNVVAGKIVKIEPHQNSDHLQICQIDIGGGEPVQIVTGADNVFEGAIVPVALHNSLLSNGMNIKKGKLRGVASNGMLCSGGELCLKESDYPGAEVNGILILKDDIAPGTDMRDILGLYDYIVDFKITANRPDCQSVIGIAREVGVVLGTKFHPPVPEYKTCSGNIADHISVEVENYDICSRYYGRVVKNVRIAESPVWLKRCIAASGMRPINNIVDITNFVMLETGLPMHAFDLRYVAESKIIVRNAFEGERIVTLDNKEHTLINNMLVIADGAKPSCLAGIMGGLESEIKDDTNEIFFECAKFRRDSIRRTARKLGMRTESSARFERGVDILTVEYAMNRAMQLVSDLDAGDIVDGIIDRNNGLPKKRKLEVTVKSINNLLGVNISSETMVEILNNLCIETTEANGMLTCLVPSFRDDIEGRADLAEEVMRIYGYDHIIGTSMVGQVVRGRKLPERIKTDKIKNVLIAGGLREISTYSFIGSKAIDILNLDVDDERRNSIDLLNPLGDEYSTMRTQLVTSMLTVLATNYNRKNPRARLFEVSKIFVPKSLPVVEQPLEVPAFSVGLYGEGDDFFVLKGIVESVLNIFCKGYTFERSNQNYLHPGRQANAVLGDEILAVLGEVHPTVAGNYGIDTRAFVAEIALDKLLNLPENAVIFKSLPKFPAVQRDIALLCDVDITAATLEEAIRLGAGNLCEKVELFDVYTGSQIPSGKKSVAYSLSLRSAESTLTDEIIDRTVKKVFKRLELVGATLRL
ncbi:MAG: phenylalanine--tRNA ligase subunit beta [Oscillospiraceae bacterium]|nr:phenylalanine--tRNA ligase subunit beta [Oscillospiraceae bacterium]